MGVGGGVGVLGWLQVVFFLVPTFNSVANAALVSVPLPVQCPYSVGRGSLETTNIVLDIMCLTWAEWSYP